MLQILFSSVRVKQEHKKQRMGNNVCLGSPEHIHSCMAVRCTSIVKQDIIHF